MTDIQQRLALAWDEFIESDEGEEQFGYGNALDREDRFGTDKRTPSFSIIHCAAVPKDEVDAPPKKRISKKVNSMERALVIELILLAKRDWQIERIAGLNITQIGEIRKIFTANTGLQFDFTQRFNERLLCPLCKRLAYISPKTRTFWRHMNKHLGKMCNNSGKSYTVYYQEANIPSVERFSIVEIAKMLNVSGSWIETRIKEGVIKTVPWSKPIAIRLQDVPDGLVIYKRGRPGLIAERVTDALEVIDEIAKELENPERLKVSIKKLYLLMNQAKQKILDGRIERTAGLPA